MLRKQQHMADNTNKAKREREKTEERAEGEWNQGEATVEWTTDSLLFLTDYLHLHVQPPPSHWDFLSQGMINGL